MDCYQGVVQEYLRSDRAIFVNPECRIQLDDGDALGAGRHWYCDAVAVSFRESTVYLCEVSYSRSLAALFRRLREWDANWPAVCASLRRDCHIPSEGWSFRPWVFVRGDRRARVSRKIDELRAGGEATDRIPRPLVTALEDVVPWLDPQPDRLPGTRESEG